MNAEEILHIAIRRMIAAPRCKCGAPAAGSKRHIAAAWTCRWPIGNSAAARARTEVRERRTAATDARPSCRPVELMNRRLRRPRDLWTGPTDIWRGSRDVRRRSADIGRGATDIRGRPTDVRRRSTNVRRRPRHAAPSSTNASAASTATTAANATSFGTTCEQT